MSTPRVQVAVWMASEDAYTASKGLPNQDAEHLRDGLDSWFIRAINQYLDRAKAFEQGANEARAAGDPESARELELRMQQALAKSLMTLRGCVEASVEVYGPLPQPGRPSGYITP